MANVIGTSGNDSITPTGVSDGVTGGVPSDDADSILGGAGADTIDGGGGDDSLQGQGGIDSLSGGDGDDRLGGNGGNDTLLGRDGNDWLNGHWGDDWLRGGRGDDVLQGDVPIWNPLHVAGDDVLWGDGGDDRLTGFGGADSYLGGDGNDVIVIHDLDFATLDGGSGIDKLKVATAGLDLDFTTAAGPSGMRARVTGIETLDLRDGDHTVTLDEDSVLAIGSSTGKLKVLGTDSDSVALTNTFAASGQQVRGATTFDVYTAGAATVWVETGISVTTEGVPKPAPFELADLDGSNGFVIEGSLTGEAFGVPVSGAGDINGDGFDDVIIGASGDYAGESHVIFGSGDPFDARIPVATLDGGNGFTLNGIRDYDSSGWSGSGAGDINGDGFGDLIIGAPQPSSGFYYPQFGGRGESYVVFGSADPFAAEIELSDLDGGNGFTLRGEARNDFAGGSVSGAGDVNGDGYDDVIIGAEGADPDGRNSAGESYVIFGSADPFGSVIELSGLDGSNGFVLDGVDTGDRSGTSVSGAGDINGDGYDDLIIGASSNYSGRPGISHVVFGSGDPFDAVIELADLDGTNGFAINGIDVDDRSGESVSGAGDVNGDGYDDLIIGAPGADANGILRAGESYVVFGSGDPFDASIELSSLDGGNGFVINGIDVGDYSGGSVSGAGDVNGDGFDDVIIGAAGADPNGERSAGESYVVFGKSGGFDAFFELSALDGGNGFVINGIDRDDRSGRSVSGAGDVNGDGFDDVLIGAPEAAPRGVFRAGTSYVVFGSGDPFDATFELADLDGGNGFTLNGVNDSDHSGFAVSGAGDVNGDGYDDLIIGTAGADPNGKAAAGESYVVFGGETIGAGGALTVDLGADLGTDTDPLLL